jgi:hypothetical protein
MLLLLHKHTPDQNCHAHNAQLDRPSLMQTQTCSPLHFCSSVCVFRRDAGAPFERLGDSCCDRVIGAPLPPPMLLLGNSMEMWVQCASSSPDAEPYRYPVCVRFAEHAKHPGCEIRYASDTRLFLSPHSQAQCTGHAPRGLTGAPQPQCEHAECWRTVDFSRAAQVLAALLSPDSAPASKRPLDWRNNLAAHPHPAADAGS